MRRDFRRHRLAPDGIEAPIELGDGADGRVARRAHRIFERRADDAEDRQRTGAPERLERGGAQGRRRQQRLEHIDRQRRAQPIEPFERRLRQEQLAATERVLQGRARRRAADVAERFGRGDAHVGILIVDERRQRHARAQIADEPERIGDELAMLGPLVERVEQRWHRLRPEPDERLDDRVAPSDVLRLGERRRQDRRRQRRIGERRRPRRRLLAHAPARIAHRLDEEVEELGGLLRRRRRLQPRDRAATNLLLVAAQPEARFVEREAHAPSPLALSPTRR